MDEKDYLFVLEALKEIPFGVGLKLLTCFLQGDESNDSIKKNKLHQLSSFGSLAYSREEIKELSDNLLMNGLIQQNSINGKKFWKVFEITDKGKQEIENPQLYKKKLSFNFQARKTVITEEDKKIFDAFGEFLSQYNDEQKKAIISNNKSILCIAGAGSGKTTVLTKRVEFLIKYRSINPEKILAITFTRKARREMMRRLENFEQVHIETFNSFCEKTLNKYNDLIYDKKFRLISYKDKIVLINKALQSLNKNIQQAIDIYFSHSQKNGKSGEHLARIFMNDCFFILDYFKFKNRILEKSAFQTNNQFQNASAELVFNVCKYVEEFMKNTGLRDYADQLIEVIKLFENKKESIPEFDYILIDEYQDVNSTQIKLIDLLSPKNIFCVGDPRQSIFGWRGSDIKYILNFEEKYSECEFITLTKNYRSTKHIVDLINTSIKSMKLPDLTSSFEGEKNTHLFSFDTELAEFEFVIQRILSLNIPRKEIFVLARTNKQLKELSQILKLRQIKHLIRTEETKKTIEPQDDEITLATIHSIKGLEAEVVFIIGCNNSNFPCKTSDHPVIDMIKVEEYDKEEEEKRLFYVGMSRAKKQLYLTHSGKKPTSFVTEEMLNLMKPNTSKLQPAKTKINIDFSNDAVTKLKEWRRKTSVQQGMPAYIIMHDKTLIEIAQKLPENKTELEFINGMGPNKISKYGEEILEILHAN